MPLEQLHNGKTLYGNNHSRGLANIETHLKYACKFIFRTNQPPFPKRNI